MRKVLILIFSFLVIVAGAYTFLKWYSPLAVYSSGFGLDGEVQLVEAGNKSPIGTVKIEEVLVNNNDSPSEVKIQVSHHMQGFVITDDFDGEVESEYTFKEVNAVSIQPDTHPQKQLEKVNAGTATEDDLIYSLSCIHNEPINQVTIKYRHLGVSHKKTLSVD
ncbi:hypothetical protein [Salipaludibacillus aurantiacus]|uniref:Uncharacterized protein n=1 Tax=Salipaludibacillus aurantiacus TaxID=1601833 RepID=A0A1H9Q8F3_9BACI|nr:hypothetical protein [Salipaludibacillus aurantiacus]SER56143.1 hypothetical protein SAMN05518684_10263 [Salipaludibacillus aurantiacus]